MITVTSNGSHQSEAISLRHSNDALKENVLVRKNFFDLQWRQKQLNNHELFVNNRYSFLQMLGIIRINDTDGDDRFCFSNTDR